MSDARIEELILNSHDAAVGACSWADVLRDIARNFDATGAAIFTADPGDLTLTSFRNGCLPARVLRRDQLAPGAIFGRRTASRREAAPPNPVFLDRAAGAPAEPNR